MNPLVSFGAHHKYQARGFAGGGSVDDAKAVSDAMCKKYGVGCNTKPTPAPTPAAPPPVAQTPPQPKPDQSGGLLGMAKRALTSNTKRIDEAAGYALGGVIRDGNSFSQDLTTYNPLTALSGQKDRFGNDMTFTNNLKSQLQEIAAPSTPSVAPPSPTTQNPLTALATQPATPFTGAYAPGGVNDPRKAFSRGGMIKGPGTPTSDSIPAKVKETGEEVSVSTDERILSKAQDAFLEKLAKDLGFESLEEMLEAGTGQPVGPTINANQRGAATGGKFDETDPNRERGFSSVPTADEAEIAAQRRATTPPTYSAAAGSLSAAANHTSDQNKAFAERFGVLPSQDGPVLRAMHGKPEQKAISAPSNESTGGPAKSDANPANAVVKAGRVNPLVTPKVPNVVNSAVTGMPYSPPSSGNLDGTGRVGNADVKATQQEGIHRINVAGQSPVYTNLDTETALKGLSAAKSGAPSISSISINGTNGGIAGGIDNTGPSVFTLHDSGRAESQALMDKWGREDSAKEMISAMANNPKAANALAQLFHAQQGTETSLADMANRREIANTSASNQMEMNAANNSTQRRGQDIAAQTHADQLAGNPLDNEMKRAQVTTANMAIDKARQQAKLLADIHAEADPAKRQALIEGLLAGQGKNVNENRFIKVDGGEETNDLGVKYKKPSGVFDAVTKQFIPMEQSAAPAAAPNQAQIDYLKKNPQAAADFDAKFGAGAAKQYL